jgi:flagellar hook-associated protein 2
VSSVGASVQQVFAMGRIQSSVGLVTGLNIQDTVDKLMQLNAIPRDRLVARNQQVQREQVAYTELTALVVGVQLTTDRLGQASLYSATRVTSSKTDALTVRSTGSPKPGSYSFTPVRQAQAQQLTSAQFANDKQLVGAGDITIRTGGFLDDSVNLDDLNGGRGIQRGKIAITDRSGASATIDLRFAQTAQDVVDAINGTKEIKVTASLEGGRFKLTDNSGSTDSNLIVTEAGSRTARDLGLETINTAADSATGRSIHNLARQTALNSLLDGRGLEFRSNRPLMEFSLNDGTKIEFSSQLDTNRANLGQLIDELNTASQGKFSVEISSSGDALQFRDLTTGNQPLSITSRNGNLAKQLGWEVAEGEITGPQPGGGAYVAGEPLVGRRLLSGLGDVLLNSLSGGSGIESLGQISITDRSGAVGTIDLSSAQTVNEVVQLLNASSLGIKARLNENRTGIEIIDTTGQTNSNLIIANGDNSDTATRLGLANSVAGTSVDSGALNRQFVSRNTTLSEYTGGKEFTAGRIRFINSAGQEATLNLRGRQMDTVGNMLDAINDLRLGVRASINATGDGLILVDEAGGNANLVVTDLDGGNSAGVLGLAGSAATIQMNGEEVRALQSSRNIRLTLNDEASVGDLVKSLNDLENSPLRAALLNANSNGSVRLLLSHTATGTRNRFAIDSNIDLGLVETSQAQDALLAVGGSENGGGVLVASNSNTFTNVVDEFSLTIASTSTTPVTISVTANDETLSNQVKSFVEQYNRVIDKVRELTRFDAKANSVGLLFGSSAVMRIESSFGQLFSARQSGSGSVRSLAQLGVQFNESGKLDFDQTKLRNAIENDRQGVENFFRAETTGFSARAKVVADNLAGVNSGALLNRSNTLQSKIEQNLQRIDLLSGRLDKQRERLLKQFNGMEAAIAKTQNNLQSLNNLQIIPPLFLARS